MIDKIRCIFVEPNKVPEVIEIDNTLKTLQKMVGGYIEAIYPYEDPVALIMNEDGKFTPGFVLNRALYTKDGEMYDAIAGPFLIVGLTEEDFGSLEDDLIQKYREKFYFPEIFSMIDGNIIVTRE